MFSPPEVRGDFRGALRTSIRACAFAKDKTSAHVPSRSAQGPIVIGIPQGLWEMLCACSEGESLKQSRSGLFAGEVRLID